MEPPRIISGSSNSCFLLTYTASKREEVVREAGYFNKHYKKKHIQVKQAVVLKNNTVTLLHGLGLLRAAACLLDYVLVYSSQKDGARFSVGPFPVEREVSAQVTMLARCGVRCVRIEMRSLRGAKRVGRGHRLQ